MWATRWYAESRGNSIRVLQLNSNRCILCYLSVNWIDCFGGICQCDFSYACRKKNHSLSFPLGDLGDVACYSVATNLSAEDKGVSWWRSTNGQAYLDILTLTFVRLIFFFSHSENVISIRKKGNCLKMYLIKKLCCVYSSFCVRVCVGVSGPNTFDILITCRIGSAASERNALWNAKNALFRS